MKHDLHIRPVGVRAFGLGAFSSGDLGCHLRQGTRSSDIYEYVQCKPPTLVCKKAIALAFTQANDPKQILYGLRFWRTHLFIAPLGAGETAPIF